jgi:prephenate dehydrogenase
MADGCYRYVGSHPMAGLERHGIAGASEALFEDALCFVTPTSQTDPRALDIITRLWQDVGSHVRVVAPADHDRIVAHASHVPHVIAAALMNATPAAAMSCVGAGFLDATRIASSDPRLWTDLCLGNRERLIEALARLDREVTTLRDILSRRAEAELLAWLEGAKAMRDHHAQT